MARRGSRTYLKYLVALSAAGFAPVIAAGPALAAPVGGSDLQISAGAISALSQSIGTNAMCDWGEWGQWGEWSEWGEWGEWSECASLTGVPLDNTDDLAAKVTGSQSLLAILRET